MTEELNPLPTQGIQPIFELADQLKARASATLLGADIFVCDICGAIMADVMKHAMWHEALNTHRHQAPQPFIEREYLDVHRHDLAIDGAPVLVSTARSVQVVTNVTPTMPAQPDTPWGLGKRL